MLVRIYTKNLNVNDIQNTCMVMGIRISEIYCQSHNFRQIVLYFTVDIEDLKPLIDFLDGNIVKYTRDLDKDIDWNAYNIDIVNYAKKLSW